MRFESFLEWKRIFWRPSSTVTANCLHLIDLAVSTICFACPSIVRKFGLGTKDVTIFSIAGKVEDEDGSFALRIHLDDNHNC